VTHSDVVAIERSMVEELLELLDDALELAEQTGRSVLAEDLERLRRALQERVAEEGAA
jgi:hypothetical protein